MKKVSLCVYGGQLSTRVCIPLGYHHDEMGDAELELWARREYSIVLIPSSQSHFDARSSVYGTFPLLLPLSNPIYPMSSVICAEVGSPRFECMSSKEKAKEIQGGCANLGEMGPLRRQGVILLIARHQFLDRGSRPSRQGCRPPIPASHALLDVH